MRIVVYKLTRNSLYFQHSCFSYVGRIGRRQDITLARRCWKRGIVVHEIGTKTITTLPFKVPLVDDKR